MLIHVNPIKTSIFLWVSHVMTVMLPEAKQTQTANLKPWPSRNSWIFPRNGGSFHINHPFPMVFPWFSHDYP